MPPSRSGQPATATVAHPARAALHVRRSRVRALRMLVVVLAGIVGCFVAHLRSGTEPPEGPHTALAHRHAVSPRSPASVPTLTLAPALRKANSGCGNTAALAFAYPLVCTFTTALGFAYLGGPTLRPEFWTEHNTVVFIVAMHHEPRLRLTPSFGQLSSLRWLMLQYSSFGNVPSEFGLLESCEFVYVRSNDFEGLPSELGLLTALTNVDCGLNQIATALPTQLGMLTKLTAFAVEANLIPGTIPSEVARMTSLLGLFVDDNRLEGSLPSQLGLLPQLTRFFFTANGISGPLPSQLGQISSLTELRGANCSLSGSLPRQLASPSSMRFLDLSGNLLSGTVPSEIGLLTHLSILDLADNDLSGSLPSELALLTKVRAFDVSGNPQLSGLLPRFPHAVPSCLGTAIDDELCRLPTDPPAFVSPVALWVVFGMTIATAVGLLIVIVLTAWLREVNIIKATNPAFTILTLVGMLLLTVAVFPYGLSMVESDKASRDTACRSIPILSLQGATLVLSATIVRNYPIWRIFVSNAEMTAVRLTKAALMRPVLVCSAITLALAAMTAVHTEATAANECSSSDRVWYFRAALGFVGALAVVATVTSFQIRNVPSEFNDTQQIAKATYTAVTFGTAMGAISLLANDPTPKFLALSLTVLLCVITFVLVMHAHKLERGTSMRFSHV